MVVNLSSALLFSLIQGQESIILLGLFNIAGFKIKHLYILQIAYFLHIFVSRC